MAWVSGAFLNDETFLSDETELPVNKIKGEYDSLEEYLSTHFKLLKEDLTAPYKHAVTELRRRTQRRLSGPISDVQVYKNVRLLRLRPESGGIEYALRFGEIEGQGEEIEWVTAKLLMHNSLLCISGDGFQTFFWAVVSTRRAHQLNNGRVIGVTPLDGFRSVSNLTGWIQRDREYIMFESTCAFFEAYQHVLDVLARKEMERLEFLEHLLFLKQEVEGPEYLAVAEEDGEGSSKGWEEETHKGIEEINGVCCEIGDSKGKSLDIALGREAVVTGLEVNGDRDNGLSEQTMEWLHGKFGIAAWDNGILHHLYESNGKRLEGGTWRKKIAGENRVKNSSSDSWVNDHHARQNNESNIEFDRSQQDAIIHGLSKKLALIQGPAGTGKTFVGLHIMKQLLCNRRVPNPLIVVCYTNRALDQFLEGVYKYETCLVRLGTGSKSRVLDNCSPESFRKIFRIGVPKELGNAKRKLRNLQADLARGLHFYADCMEAKSVNRMALSRVVRRVQVENLYFCDVCSEEDIYSLWLSGKSRMHVSPNCPDSSSCTSYCEETFMEFQTFGDFVDNPASVALFMDDSDIGNLWDLTPHTRLRLHEHWLVEIHNYGSREFKKLASEYDSVCQKISNIQMKIQLHILRNTRVLGMTTTVAARYFDLLSSLKPAVMIVEEAAEVLEAQLLACLNPHIKHLILIGDHKQLRPSISSPHLASQNQLDVSMFERLVVNGIEYKTLQVQRRMRPAIAHLTEIFYPSVIDHRAVQSLDNVRGVKHNVFFFDHQNLEESFDNSASKVNLGEAALVAELAFYLVNRCGYSWKDITVLSMYRCQMNEINKLLNQQVCSTRKRPKTWNTCGDLKVRSVDEFQGEESNIVILSLVRNRTNEDQLSHPECLSRAESIGFLGNANRICVALTRARLGLFIFGNSDLLSSKSIIWDHIIELLSINGWIGSRMKLCCPKHVHNEFGVRTVEDFGRARCPIKCQFTLPCGHSCPKRCHFGDHRDIVCDRKCRKNLSCGHLCLLLCHFEHPDRCYPCPKCKECA